MSASRLYFFLQTTPLTMLRTPNSLSSLSLLRFTAKPLFSQTLHFRSYSYPATVASESAIEGPTSQAHPHPWPEWVSFVDRLKSHGYFPQTSSSSSNDDLVYRDIKFLKDPCLSFARDRYDIFRSLSKDDIHSIVEGGCPKIVRKVVNSAKRLRVYVGLDERNVCSVCSLQGSCDRAYVTLKESEGEARTVDLMRLLVFYALDPLVISGAVRPPGIELAESSARRLLSMLIDLSESSPSPAPVELSIKASYRKEQVVNSMDALPSQNVAIREGDWMCPKCNFNNFARNQRCRKCKCKGPKQDGADDVEMKIADVEMKKGDWNCPKCECMNFASRKYCFRCKEHRPPRTLEPGEWECPKCDLVNFRRNVSCFKCGSERSKEPAEQNDDQSWRIRPTNFVL